LVYEVGVYRTYKFDHCAALGQHDNVVLELQVTKVYEWCFCRHTSDTESRGGGPLKSYNIPDM